MKNKALKALNNFEEYILAVLLPLMVITIFVATFMRFTNIQILTWAEELARYTMIWILFFGISAAAKRGEHFCIMVFAELFPKSVQKIIAVIRMVLMTGFMLFVGRFCVFILQNQMKMGQVSPALFWPMWTMYSAVLIGCTLMLIRYLVFGIRELRNDTIGKKE
jgi:C4-dicarboxylate transporter DctQ subunit